MRILILSDIHGNLPALEAVLVDGKRHKADLTVNLGDCVSGPLWPKETCDLLMTEAWPTTRGNCDREVGQGDRTKMWVSDAFARDRLPSGHRQWLANLPQTIALSDNVLACHGTPADDDDYLIDDIVGGHLVAPTPSAIRAKLGDCQADVILCGHSHVPRTCRAADGRLVVNPGSVGMPAYESEFEGTTYVAEAGSPHARYAVLTRRGKRWTVDHLAVEYDWERAAQQAEANDRPDFVQALRHGTMRT